MTRSKPKPLLKERAEFVQHHLRGKRGSSVFAPFTGQDYSAWSAFQYLLDLYGRSDGNGRQQAVVAMRAMVAACQSTVLDAFKKSIPAALDWSDEPDIWRMIAPCKVTDPYDIPWPCADGERECTDPAHSIADPKQPDQSKPCPDCGAVYIIRSTP